MLIEMLAQCRSFSSRRQYIYTPKQQQQTWKKPCGRFYFPNTAKICSSLLYDLDTTHTGRSSPCTWSFVSTYGRCDDLQLLSQRMWQSFSFSLPPTLPPFPFPFFIPFLSSSLLFFLPSSLSLSLSLPTWVLESSRQVLREPKKCTREVQESIHVDILAEADSQHRCQTHKNAVSRTPVPVTI